MTDEPRPRSKPLPSVPRELCNGLVHVFWKATG